MAEFILLTREKRQDLIAKMNEYLKKYAIVEIEYVSFEYGNNICLLRCTYE